MQAQAGPGRTIRLVHRLEGYQLKTDVQFQGLDRLTEGNRQFTWNAVRPAEREGLSWERQHSAIYYLELGEERDYLSDGKEAEETLEEGLSWLSFKQNYFSALVSSPQPLPRADASPTSCPRTATYVMGYMADLPYDGQPLYRFRAQRPAGRTGGHGAGRSGAHHRLRMVDLRLGQPEHHPADLRVHRELHRQLGPHRVDPDACHQKRPLPDHMEELHELGEDAGLASELNEINEHTPKTHSSVNRKPWRSSTARRALNPDSRVPACVVADAHPVRHVPVLPLEH